MFALPNASSIPLYYASDAGIIPSCQKENSSFALFLMSEAMWVSLAYAPDCSLSISGSEGSPDPNRSWQTPAQPLLPEKAELLQLRLIFLINCSNATCFFLCWLFPDGSSD